MLSASELETLYPYPRGIPVDANVVVVGRHHDGVHVAGHCRGGQMQSLRRLDGDERPRQGDISGQLLEIWHADGSRTWILRPDDDWLPYFADQITTAEGDVRTDIRRELRTLGDSRDDRIRRVYLEAFLEGRLATRGEAHAQTAMEHLMEDDN